MGIREKILNAIIRFENLNNGKKPDYLFLDKNSFSIYKHENNGNQFGEKIEGLEYAVFDYGVPHIECHLKARLDGVIDFWSDDADELEMEYIQNENKHREVNFFLRKQIEAYGKKIGKEPFKLV